MFRISTPISIYSHACHMIARIRVRSHPATIYQSPFLLSIFSTFPYLKTMIYIDRLIYSRRNEILQLRKFPRYYLQTSYNYPYYKPCYSRMSLLLLVIVNYIVPIFLYLFNLTSQTWNVHHDNWKHLVPIDTDSTYRNGIQVKRISQGTARDLILQSPSIAPFSPLSRSWKKNYFLPIRQYIRAQTKIFDYKIPRELWNPRVLTH